MVSIHSLRFATPPHSPLCCIRLDIGALGVCTADDVARFFWVDKVVGGTATGFVKGDEQHDSSVMLVAVGKTGVGQVLALAWVGDLVGLVTFVPTVIA